MNKPSLNGWTRPLIWGITTLVLVVTAFIVVREGVSTNADRIAELQADKASREVVQAQFDAIMRELQTIRAELRDLRNQR